jgi:flagellar motor switch protein FliG
MVYFEDLALLDPPDLRAVIEHVPIEQVLDALVGTPPGLREIILTKLPSATAARLAEQIAARGPLPFEVIERAQRALVEALCDLGREGLVAFDDPEDMVA